MLSIKEKIVSYAEKSKPKHYNQYHYIFLYALISFIVAGFSIVMDTHQIADVVSYIQIWGIKLLNGGLFLGSGFGLSTS